MKNVARTSRTVTVLGVEEARSGPRIGTVVEREGDVAGPPRVVEAVARGSTRGAARPAREPRDSLTRCRWICGTRCQCPFVIADASASGDRAHGKTRIRRTPRSSLGGAPGLVPSAVDSASPSPVRSASQGMSECRGRVPSVIPGPRGCLTVGLGVSGGHGDDPRDPRSGRSTWSAPANRVHWGVAGWARWLLFAVLRPPRPAGLVQAPWPAFAGRPAAPCPPRAG